MMMMII